VTRFFVLALLRDSLLADFAFVWTATGNALPTVERGIPAIVRQAIALPNTPVVGENPDTIVDTDRPDLANPRLDPAIHQRNTRHAP
jgi:hypothetical protein